MKFTKVINIKDFDVEVRETKLGPEQVTRDIPNVSEHSLRHLGEDGIVAVPAISSFMYLTFFTECTRKKDTPSVIFHL